MKKRNFFLAFLLVFAIGYFWKNYAESIKKFLSKKPSPPQKEKVVILPAPKEELIAVYISGCINKPGIYKIKKETTLRELVEKAGGISPKADIEKIDFSRKLIDGDVIEIPKMSLWKTLGFGEAPPKTYIIEPMEIVEEK